MSSEIWVAIIGGFITLLVTIITTNNTNRKEREKRDEDLVTLLNSRLDILDEKFDKRDKALLDLMRQSLVDAAETYITQGCISTPELTSFEELWSSYTEFHGNHGMEVLEDKVSKLPIKND